jgi:hypothetical protein
MTNCEFVPAFHFAIEAFHFAIEARQFVIEACQFVIPALSRDPMHAAGIWKE